MVQQNLFSFFALACVLTYSVSGLAADMTGNEMDGMASKDDDRRATWLETRDLEESFEQLTLISLRELINKGYVRPDVLLNKAEEKRGRHQGFCFKKTKSGKYLPYICWKDQEE
jgi:hypothetical protein